MSKVQFNNEILEFDCFDVLQNVKNTLKNNIDMLNTIELSPDFIDTVDFDLIKKEFSKSYDDIININNDIENLNNLLDDFCNNYDDYATNLPVSTLKKRNISI